MVKHDFKLGRTENYFLKKINFNNNKLVLDKLTCDSVKAKDDITLGGLTRNAGVHNNSAIVPIGIYGSEVSTTADYKISIQITQPANTFLNGMGIYFNSNSGDFSAASDVGFCVGITEYGDEIVAFDPDNVLDDGNTTGLTKGNVCSISGSHLVDSGPTDFYYRTGIYSTLYTTVSRTIYLTLATSAPDTTVNLSTGANKGGNFGTSGKLIPFIDFMDNFKIPTNIDENDFLDIFAYT